MRSAAFACGPWTLRAAVTPATRVVLLNSPHNPTGAVLTQRDVREIGEVCLAHDLWIVCDEVYEAIIFDGEFASPFDDPALADRAVALSSISKSHAAPGFRSGWAVGPAEFCARLTPISEAMLFGSQPFIADMTAHALARPNATAPELTRNYRRRAELFVALLSEAPGVRPLMPQAGMFALLDVSGTGLDGDAFAPSAAGGSSGCGDAGLFVRPDSEELRAHQPDGSRRSPSGGVPQDSPRSRTGPPRPQRAGSHETA